MSSSLQNLFVLIGLILVLVLGYYLYTQNQQAKLSSSIETVNNNVSLESADFLRKLSELQTISFQQSSSIFNDPRFISLVDHKVPIDSLPVGRENPFEPVD